MTPTYDSLRAMHPHCGGEESLSIRGVMRRFYESTDDQVNMHPDYQRGVAWSDNQCSKFIGFIAEGGTPPPVWVQRWPNYDDELVDGLQRITAVRRFYLNEIPMELTDGTLMYLRDFSPEDQRMLCGNGGPILTLKYVKYTNRADVLRFYLRLNRGGTPHSDGEIDRVRDLLSKELEP